MSVSQAQLSSHRSQVFFRSFPLTSNSFPNVRRLKFNFFKIHMNYVVFMSRTIKILISNWPRTQKFSQLLQAGKTVALDFALHGHSLLPIFVLWLVKIWQVSSCGKLMHHLESAAIRSLLLLMANWFLVEKYATCQSRKSDFGWYRFNCAMYFIWILKKIKLEPGIIWKLVTCHRITSKNTWLRWVDTWARETLKWYWSADTLFWQLCSQTS